MSTATLSQFSCFSSIGRERKVRIGKSQLVSTPCRFKFSVRMDLDGSGIQIPTSESENTLSYGADASKLHVEAVVKSYPINQEPVPGADLNVEAAVQSYPINEELVPEKLKMDESIPEQAGVASQKKTAKIHDFCLGIPFGGVVLSGGLVGSVLSRNLATLGTSVLFGGGLLALSIFSLKVWKQGKSSLPLILGQAALAVVLLTKHLQNYSLTKKVFPAGFYALISAAMLCFYSYVLASGGNPPPKKSKVAAASSL